MGRRAPRWWSSAGAAVLLLLGLALAGAPAAQAELDEVPDRPLGEATHGEAVRSGGVEAAGPATPDPTQASIAAVPTPAESGGGQAAVTNPTDPPISVSLPADASTYRPADLAEGPQVSLGDGAVSSAVAGFAVTPGSHVMTVTAVDAAGNESTTNVAYEVIEEAGSKESERAPDSDEPPPTAPTPAEATTTTQP